MENINSKNENIENNTRVPEKALAITMKDAAELLCCGTATITALIHRKKNPLPSIKVGRRYIIPKHAFEVWLDERAWKDE